MASPTKKLVKLAAEIEAQKQKVERLQKRFDKLKVNCTHPKPYYLSGMFVASCSLCGWDNY